MRFKVTFTKRFTDGLLVGLTYDDAVTFSTWQGAQDYASWLATRTNDPVTPCAGSSKYVVTGAILIQRMPVAVATGN